VVRMRIGIAVVEPTNVVLERGTVIETITASPAWSAEETTVAPSTLWPTGLQIVATNPRVMAAPVLGTVVLETDRVRWDRVIVTGTTTASKDLSAEQTTAERPILVHTFGRTVVQ